MLPEHFVPSSVVVLGREMWVNICNDFDVSDYMVQINVT